MTNRTCKDCGTGITVKNRSGRCRACGFRLKNADPEFRARRVAGIRKRFEDPAARAKAAREIHIRHLTARRRPDVAEKMRVNFMKARTRLNDPDVREAFLATRAEAGKKRSRTCMAWCPDEYRAEYTRLVRSKKLKAAEAKRIILAQLSPFERQMQALRNGAGILEKPILRSRGYDFTLGGVTDLAA